MVFELKTATDDGVEKTFSFAGSCAGGNEGGLVLVDGTEGGFLVAVEGGVGDDLLHVGMEDPFLDQGLDGGSLLEEAAKADVGAFE